jgi:hypothetical protein
MGSHDVSGDSFVVKVWLENTPAESTRAHWRGYVTHVASGQRRYAQHLEDVSLIIMPYLQAMGVRFSAISRLRQWLFERRRSPNNDQ